MRRIPGWERLRYRGDRVGRPVAASRATSASSARMVSLPVRDILGELTPVEQKLAPGVLHVAGDVDLLRASPKVADTLVGLGATVVSGLAQGIDTAAHKAALRAGGRTFAVIGTGLDISYPRGNQRLQQHLMTNFAVVSQFRAGSPPARRNFPQRNRTMALLSDALVIVEAAEKSGTISQGWETLRLGRTLFLLEAVANNPALSWPAEMRRYGAEVLRLRDLDHILEDLPCVTMSGAIGF